MSKPSERRRWPRETLNTPTLGIVENCCCLGDDGNQATHVFVEVHNLSDGGAFIITDRGFTCRDPLTLLLLDPRDRQWKMHNANICWVQDHCHPSQYLAGLEYLQCIDPDGEACHIMPQSSKPHVADLDFLLSSKLLSAIPQDSLFPLINSLTRVKLKPGERLITQGDGGDALYLIQKGECTVSVEKNGESFKIAKLRAGDVVGEMAVLTGEVRTAHVDADTDLEVWELKRDQFLELSELSPDLRIFLTELITRRFDSSHHTADRTVGKYVINRKLGRGGWSIVYQGTHSTLNMPVAIKMMRHDMAMEEEFLETFRQEATLIASLSHPNIVQVYDIEELYKTVFILMEYLEGQSLKDKLERQGVLPLSQTVSTLTQIYSGLAYAHERGVVHRDIKPANIFLQPDGRVRILDFGLACAPGTEDMSLAGTVKYAPPEQIDGDPVDGRSDIYSTGIMAYEMVCGQRPYPEDDLGELMDLHCEEDIPDPRELEPNLPKDLARFIMKACAREPDNRHQTAEEARLELLRISRTLGLDEETDPLEPRKMTSLFLFYNNDKRSALTDLLEEFGERAQRLGIDIKVAEFKDI